MNKSVVITARIDQQLSMDLDRLAKLRDRSRAWLVEKAIAAFIREEFVLHASLAEAEAQIERGEYLAHDDFMRQLKAEFGARQAA